MFLFFSISCRGVEGEGSVFLLTYHGRPFGAHVLVSGPCESFCASQFPS